MVSIKCIYISKTSLKCVKEILEGKVKVMYVAT